MRIIIKLGGRGGREEEEEEEEGGATPKRRVSGGVEWEWESKRDRMNDGK